MSKNDHCRERIAAELIRRFFQPSRCRTARAAAPESRGLRPPSGAANTRCLTARAPAYSRWRARHQVRIHEDGNLIAVHALLQGRVGVARPPTRRRARRSTPRAAHLASAAISSRPLGRPSKYPLPRGAGCSRRLRSCPPPPRLPCSQLERQNWQENPSAQFIRDGVREELAERESARRYRCLAYLSPWFRLDRSVRV